MNLYFLWRHKKNCTFKKSATGTLLPTDERVTISITVDNLQTAVYKSKQIITEHELLISVENTKLMVFKRRESVRIKIVIDNKIIKYVNSFKYLGNFISYVREVDIEI